MCFRRAEPRVVAMSLLSRSVIIANTAIAPASVQGGPLILLKTSAIVPSLTPLPSSPVTPMTDTDNLTDNI